MDGHDILIPYGQGYEGARRISEGAYGYKLLVLLNIQDDCELIVGYILGGLQESEITLLRRMLARLDKTLASFCRETLGKAVFQAVRMRTEAHE